MKLKHASFPSHWLHFPSPTNNTLFKFFTHTFYIAHTHTLISMVDQSLDSFPFFKAFIARTKISFWQTRLFYCCFAIFFFYSAAAQNNDDHSPKFRFDCIYTYHFIWSSKKNEFAIHKSRVKFFIEKGLKHITISMANAHFSIYYWSICQRFFFFRSSLPASYGQ